MLEKTVKFGVFLVFGINSNNKALKIYKISDFEVISRYGSLKETGTSNEQDPILTGKLEKNLWPKAEIQAKFRYLVF